MAVKKRWTVIDTVIVILVIAAGAACFKMFNTKSFGGTKKTIKAVVYISSQEEGIDEMMKEGDDVTISLTERDSGVLTGKKVEMAEAMVFNSMDGVYNNLAVEGRIDIYAVISIDVTENDLSYKAGSTPIKVGDKLPFRGKGFAAEGYVVGIEDGDMIVGKNPADIENEKAGADNE